MLVRKPGVFVLLMVLGLVGFSLHPFAPSAQPFPTSTPDRLARPTLPPHPSQADQGAQVYWLFCLPCHGDRGQGLTDEFRQTYPPEDRNCWTKGCHGERPYEHGFTLPKQIPPLIGPGALSRFSNAYQLKTYIQATMPYWKPASLTDEQAWQVTAFLIRQNGWKSDPFWLNDETAQTLDLLPAPAIHQSASTRLSPKLAYFLITVILLIGMGMSIRALRFRRK